MELLQLTYFCDAAKTENFSKTAANFGVPPSDISQSIKRLEKELDTELFIRGANSIRLNEKGEVFRKRIAAALDMVTDAVKALEDDGEKGVLTLCINTNRRIVMQTVEKYSRKYQNVDIYTKSVADYTGENYDLIIDNIPPKIKTYEATKLLEEKLCLAVRVDDPLSSFKRIDLKELSKRPFVTMSEAHSLYNYTFELCKKMGFTPRIAVRSDDPFYVRKCVELGLGVTIVPAVSWRGQFSDKVKLVEIEDWTRETFVFYDNTRHFSKRAANFKKMLIEEFHKEAQILG